MGNNAFAFGPDGGLEQNVTAPFSGTIFLLHGLGADSNDLVGIIPYLGLLGDQAVRFLMPNAPFRSVRVNQGMRMRAWYDITSARLDFEPDWEGISTSSDALLEWVEKEKKRGVPADRIFLAGFSQGGLVCLAAGLKSTDELGGILALSTYDPDPETLEKRWTGRRLQNLFMGHGTADPVVPYTLGQDTFQGFFRLGWKGEWFSHRETHTLTLDELKEISRWLLATVQA